MTECGGGNFGTPGRARKNFANSRRVDGNTGKTFSFQDSFLAAEVKEKKHVT